METVESVVRLVTRDSTCVTERPTGELIFLIPHSSSIAIAQPPLAALRRQDVCVSVQSKDPWVMMLAPSWREAVLRL